MARLAFFGTPEFSLPALEQLARFSREYNHELVLVVTQADKEQGRGKKLQSPPVKILAQELGIKISQPLSLKKNTEEGDKFYQEFCELNIDLVVVVAYGKIITQRLLSAAQFGFVNLHASLLPQYRGAAPIQRAIAAGDYHSGICLMNMILQLDQGDVFARIKTPILSCDSSYTLFSRLSKLGAYLLYQNLPALLTGKLKPKAQGEKNISYAHMLRKEDGLINFSRSARDLALLSRALDPWPNLYGFLLAKRIKFFDGFSILGPTPACVPGTVLVVGEFLGIKTIDGIVYFKRLQIEGKNILTISQAQRGSVIKIGDIISSTF